MPRIGMEVHRRKALIDATVETIHVRGFGDATMSEIARRAGALYDKFEGFVGDLETVGKRIDAAKGAWHDAKNKLVDGRGNVIRQTEMLKKLGASTKKALPDEYVDAAGVDAEDEDGAPALSAPERPSEAANS